MEGLGAESHSLPHVAMEGLGAESHSLPHVATGGLGAALDVVLAPALAAALPRWEQVRLPRQWATRSSPPPLLLIQLFYHKLFV